VAGRQSGQFRSEVLDHARGAELEEVIDCTTLEGTTVNTDEWKGYNGLPQMGRVHVTVNHSGPKSAWARDDDGDGVREVHCNTQEGIWTHVRLFLRRFCGVSKWYLAQHQAVFQWGYNIKAVTDEFLRILLGVPPSTDSAP
jgi:transposase-like protein